jgi:hypothetical protein
MKPGPTTRFLGLALFYGLAIALPWGLMILAVSAWWGRGL